MLAADYYYFFYFFYIYILIGRFNRVVNNIVPFLFIY